MEWGGGWRDGVGGWMRGRVEGGMDGWMYKRVDG